MKGRFSPPVDFFHLPSTARRRRRTNTNAQKQREYANAQREMNARKPKVEVDDRITTEEDGDENSRDEQEEALVALIEHRTKEVEHIRKRITYYQSQVSSFFSLLFSQFFLFSYYSPKLKLLIFFLLS